MLFDTTSVSGGEEKLTEALESARRRFRLWRKKALYSAVAFVLSCLILYSFVDGRVLSAQEESAKHGLLLLWLMSLLIFLYFSLLLWGAWRSVRDLEAGRN